MGSTGLTNEQTYCWWFRDPESKKLLWLLSYYLQSLITFQAAGSQLHRHLNHAQLQVTQGANEPAGKKFFRLEASSLAGWDVRCCEQCACAGSLEVCEYVIKYVSHIQYRYTSRKLRLNSIDSGSPVLALCNASSLQPCRQLASA